MAERYYYTLDSLKVEYLWLLGTLESKSFLLSKGGGITRVRLVSDSKSLEFKSRKDAFQFDFPSNEFVLEWIPFV